MEPENTAIARGLRRHDPDLLDRLIEQYQHRLLRYPCPAAVPNIGPAAHTNPIQCAPGIPLSLRFDATPLSDGPGTARYHLPHRPHCFRQHFVGA
jgi:hypothetical protein